jgi:hypothetical protein
MENIYIEPTENSPKVVLNYEKGLIEFEGKCYPENTFEFFEPLLEWLENYFSGQAKSKTIMNMKLSYFNSATTQSLFDIFDLIQDGESNDLVINWFYNANNENGMEDFEDYSEEFEELDFVAIPYS